MLFAYVNLLHNADYVVAAIFGGYFYIINRIRKCTDLKELTPELVNRLITKIEVFDSTKDENGKKHVPIKVHFIGVGILEIPDAQIIIDAKEEIRKNPPSAA